MSILKKKLLKSLNEYKESQDLKKQDKSIILFKPNKGETNNSSDKVTTPLFPEVFFYHICTSIRHLKRNIPKLAALPYVRITYIL